ncbi:MAG: site-specific integrase [Pseudomonadota bacterium]
MADEMLITMVTASSASPVASAGGVLIAEKNACPMPSTRSRSTAAPGNPKGSQPIDAKSGALGRAPVPILDVNSAMENPYRHSASVAAEAFDVSGFFGDGPPPNGASRDYEYALKFLYTYVGSSATLNAYRRELERLLQWAWRIERVAVIGLAREDIENFVRFTLNPPAAWVGTKNVARFVRRDGEAVPNPEWRAFVISKRKDTAAGSGAHPNDAAPVYTPSQASLRATFSVLSSFFDFLTEEKLVDYNPVSMIRQKSKFLRTDHNTALVRRITNLQWDYVIETARQAADADPAHERTVFIMNCLYGMYLRISELVADERSTPVMGDFRRDQDGHWWFHVTGKGNKDRTIVVSDAMLAALRHYRSTLGLSPLPAIGETIPLLTKNKGQGPIASTRQVRRIVQDCFDRAYARMKADGMEDDAQDLRAATVHWLRHTGISEDVKIRPREHVRDDAGHATMATTDRYIESDRRERHLSGRKKPLGDL